MTPILAQSSVSSTGVDGFDIGSYIERFGFAVFVALVLGFALWKAVRIIIDVYKENSATWKLMYERERDLRVEADKRSEVSLEQGRTVIGILEALKDRFRGGTPQ